MVPQDRQPKDVRREGIVIIQPDEIEQPRARRLVNGVEQRAELLRLEVAVAKPVADALDERAEIIREILVQRDMSLAEGDVELADFAVDVFLHPVAGNLP